VVLLLVVTHIARVILVCVVVLVGGVDLLLLGVVGDEVGGVATLEAALVSSPPLLVELVHSELSCQQDILIIWDALVLLIRSCGQKEKANSKAISYSQWIQT
jgi:hypothetical protein